jgi:hypothetical protein
MSVKRCNSTALNTPMIKGKLLAGVDFAPNLFLYGLRVYSFVFVFVVSFFCLPGF